jgi:uncharacterized protein (DUF885 family)
VTPLDGLSAEQAESSLREYNEWILQILNIHEAIPGHYAQLVHANRSPSLVKSLFGNGAMVEGWAVYGERMMLESGYGGNAPEMWLMYSKWNLRSVTNTILDYSVHVNWHGPERGDRPAGAPGLPDAPGSDRKMAPRAAVVGAADQLFQRLCGDHGTARAAPPALGERFNQKQFHDQFLSYGNAPVKMIAELMRD